MSKTQLPKNEKFGYDIGALDSYLSQAVCIVADPEILVLVDTHQQLYVRKSCRAHVHADIAMQVLMWLLVHASLYCCTHCIVGTEG